MDIVTRKEWEARPPKSVRTTTAKEIFLHHSVGSGMHDLDRDGDMGDDYMRAMQKFHMDDRGWADVAYNFAIDPVGLEVYEGRGWGIRPGSQQNYNSGTWSVVIMGDFRKQHPDGPLLSRIAELVRYGQKLGHLPLTAPLRGHRDAPGSESNHCPGGNLYTKLMSINQLIKEGDEDMPTAQEVAAEVLKQLVAMPVWQTNANVMQILSRDHRHTNELVTALRAGELGDNESIRSLTEEDFEMIAQVVNDEQDRRERLRLDS